MRLRSLRIAARASVASGLIASLLATNFGSARAYERLPVVIQTAPLPHTTLPAPPLSPQAERIRLEQLARTIGPPKRSSLPRVTTGLRRASTTGQVRVLDSSSSLSPSAASASDLLQYIAQSQALTQPRTYSGILGRPPGMSAPPVPPSMSSGAGIPWTSTPFVTSAIQRTAPKTPAIPRSAVTPRRSLTSNAVQTAVVGASVPFTGINHWWRYEEGSIPGVGRYMVNVGGEQNLLVQQDDMDVPNKGADLAFRRTYNSYSQHDYLGTDGSQISNYGDGWTNTFDAHIAYNAGNSYGQGVSVFDIDGARYDYLPSSQTASTGYYAPPPGMGGSTVYKNGNEFFCWVKRSGTQYCFYRPDMSAIVSGMDGFDGRVLWIYGRNVRNYLTFAYYFDASPDTSQNLNKIIATTEAGQSATLLFSNIKVSSGNRRLLTSLARPDGTAITYGYDSSGDLAYVSEPANSVSTPHCTCLESSYLYFSNHLLQQVFGPRNLESGDYASGSTAFGWSVVGGANTPSISEVGDVGIVNPTIPDGYSTGPIQPAYSGSSSTYRLVTYAVSGSTVTVSDSDLHQTIYDVSASGSGTITGTADYATGTDVLTHAFGYDSNFDLTYETDARGNETDYLYDSYGQEVAEAKPSVLTSSNASPIRPTSYYSYGADYNLIAYCDPVYSNAHSMNWSTTPPTASDTLCPTTAGTLQAPGATVMQWTPTSTESYGELTSITSPLGYTKTISYATSPQGGYDFGLPTSVIGATIQQDDGTTRTPTELYTYDAYGNVACFGNGVGTYALQYDSLNRRTVLADPDDGSIVQCGKPSSSYVTASYTSYFPDGSISMTQTPPQHASSGTGTTYAYDADGNRASETFYFVSGTPIKKSNWYDGDDRLIEVANGPLPSPGWLTRYLYDLSEGQGVSLSGTPTFLAYGNMFGTEIGVSSFTPTKGTAYDGLDRDTQAFRWPMSNCASSCGTASVASKAYDANIATMGLLSSKKNEVGGTATMAYDAAERVSSMTYSGDGGVTPDETMIYDADGRATSTTSSTFGVMSDTYDANGRLVKRIEPSGGRITSPATLTYDYYGDGKRQDIGVSSSALTQLPFTQYSYRADGLPQTYAAPGLSTTYQWKQTAAGRYTSQGALTQSYDSFGRAVSKSLAANAYPVTNAQYDLQDELTSAVQTSSATAPPGYASSVTKTFTYDSLKEELSDTPSADESVVCFTNECQTITRTYRGGGQTSTDTETPSGDGPGGSTNVVQSPDPRYGAILSESTTTVPQPNPTSPCNELGTQYDNRTYSYDAAGRETAGAWSWAQVFIGNAPGPTVDTVNVIGQPPGCQYVKYTGSLAQTFDSNNDVASRTEMDWDQKNENEPPVPVTWSYGWGPNGHLATEKAAFQGQASASTTLHWDGDNLLFETDQNGALEVTFVDGPLGSHDFDFAGWTSSSEGYALNLDIAQNQFQSRPITSLRYPNPPQTEYLYVGPGMLTDTVNTLQGVRQTDNMTNQWMTPDAYAGRVDDPMSQRPYMWNNNNPITYSDPSGYCPLCLVAVPAVEIGIGEALTAIGVGAVGGAMATNGQEILNSIGSLFNAHGQMQAPGLPETIVGTNPKPSSGKRVNSGPLDAAHGGTGDAEKDFDKLTGGHSGPAPNDRPPGTLLGGNRVQLRPGTPSKGPRIDIPANGTKPPETLHYPQ